MGTIGSVLGISILFAGSIRDLKAQEHTGGQSAAAIRVEIDANQVAAPVSKYIRGMFIEHLGPLIYRSLWAEMIDDRKFYFPISSADPETSARHRRGSEGWLCVSGAQ